MHSFKRQILFLTTLTLLAAACALTASPRQAPRSTITAIPTNTPAQPTPTPPVPQVTEITVPTVAPAATPTDENLLYTLTPEDGVTYFENFQRDQIPYWIFANETGFSYLEDGDLYIDLLEPGETMIFPLLELLPETNTVDMWAKITQASGDAAIGMSCRINPEAVTTSGYHIAVFLDGRFRASALTPDGQVILHEGRIIDPDFDLSKWTFFHLKCKGDVFYFTADGIPVFSGPITDPIYNEGVFGVVMWGELADPYDQFAIQVFSGTAP